MQYLADDFFSKFGEISPPTPLKKIVGTDSTGEAGINSIIGNAISLIYTVAAVSFVIMFLISAVQMILSGGDKEALAKARARLNWAIIGIVILALSFVIFRALETITGFKFINP